MKHRRLIQVSDRWFRLLLYLYPADFREEMGTAIADAFHHRATEALNRRGVVALAGVWRRALLDSLWNGPAERIRPAAAWRRGGNWGRDLEMARRRLARSPLFVAATVGTLTIGLGAFAVVYTAVDKILIAPLPYRAPQDLYFVWRDQLAASGLSRDWLSGPEVAELQRAGGVIEGAAGTQLVAPTLALRPDSEPLQVVVMLTSPNLFDLLGVPPALGRVFTAKEVGPDRPSVVILSHALWNSLGADKSIIGKHVWLSGTPYTVIGVMGPSFRFVRHATVGPPQEADAYLPFRFHVADQDPNSPSFATVVRARHGTSAGQVAAAVSAAGRAVIERHHLNRPFRLYPVGLHADLVARIKPVLLTLGLAGAFMVLVLTMNLASLLLARTAQRQREFAVARAVGANGASIVRAVLIEGAALGFAGGVAGVLLGRWGARMLVALAPLDLPLRHAIRLDWTVAAVVIGVGTVLGIAAAMVPAAWASRVPLGSILATSGVRGPGSATPMRSVMIVAQIAVSLVLLSAGGLVVRSFEQLIAADPGFRPNGLLTFTVAMGPRLFPKPDNAQRFQDRLETALRALPGVSDVSATTALPLSASAPSASITLPGAPGNTGDAQHDAPLVDIIATRARYVEVMGMRLLAGRAFDQDPPAGVREALIDRQLADRFFPGGTPIGAPILYNGQRLTVIGVVAQARLYDLHQDGRPQMYVRDRDWTAYTPSFVIHTSGDPGALVASVPRVIRQIDPRIPVSSVRTMDEIVTDAIRQQRISAVLIAGFALGALLLVAMGLFGMIAGVVTQRRGELAVRLALGATHTRVLGLVLGEGVLLVAIGMLIAVPGVYAAGGLIRGLLIGVSPLDPVTLFGVAAGLALVTAAACYVPARRVLIIDPAMLLRQQ